MSRRSPNTSATPSLLQLASTRDLIAGESAAADEALLQECVTLFNAHYGVWGPNGPRPGEHVAMSIARLRALLNSEHVSLSLIRIEGKLAGYCVVARFEVAGKGPVHWVSQLVVATEYRNVRVATELLFAAWTFSDAYAWGLATINPYAIRALETTTRRRCIRRVIVERGDELCRALHEKLSYIPERLYVDATSSKRPIVDTKFPIDHSDLQQMRQAASRSERPWQFGSDLPEGHEWLACIFGDQPIVDVAGPRLEHLFTASDATWIDAYSRMTLDTDHHWMRHTVKEAEFVAATPHPNDVVIDVGCGIGRHAVALAEAGLTVQAVDVVPEMVARAESSLPHKRVTYATLDARERQSFPTGQAGLVVALYDVLGSSAKEEDDKALLANFHHWLAPMGGLVLSVMNIEPMLASSELARADTETELVRMLERLPASASMEQTGSVFDPRLCLEFRGVFYRKEQFSRPGHHLPAELIVRDRRFSVTGIGRLVAEAGFEVQSVTPVQAGHWERSPALAPDDGRAKEILVVAQRPR